ncbi:hypothetical protein QE152_g19769 [Popillia japonica]|uniref:Uncharacterized protein n=1 Tax=Popillia japonica TaxID=7064 RepID=A0AAW1KQR3_POPJA
MACSMEALTDIQLEEILNDAEYWIDRKNDVEAKEAITEVENQVQAGLTLFNDAGESDNDDQDNKIYSGHNTDSEFEPDDESAGDLMHGNASSKSHWLLVWQRLNKMG